MFITGRNLTIPVKKAPGRSMHIPALDGDTVAHNKMYFCRFIAFQNYKVGIW